MCHQLDVGDATASRHLASTLRYATAAPEMIEYLQERNDWDDETYESVYWPAFASARSKAIDPRFIPKYSHRHLPVGVKANRNDSKYSPACPAPDCEELSKSNDHLLLCSAPSRLNGATLSSDPCAKN
jgi:hypothetical protein